jgi:hypothetical protein
MFVGDSTTGKHTSKENACETQRVCEKSVETSKERAERKRGPSAFSSPSERRRRFACEQVAEDGIGFACLLIFLA